MKDYAGEVESYICQHDGPSDLGKELSESMRRTLQGERPLTEADAKNWKYSIDLHVKHRRKQTGINQ